MTTRRRSDDDFRAEIEAHLAEEADALRAEGVPPEAAPAAARRTFGNRTTAEERHYESRRWMWGEHLLRDVRFAARILRKDLRFSVLAVLGLGLGIGISTAVFALINETIRINTEASGDLKSFVSINRVSDGGFQNEFSYQDYLLYSSRSTSLRAVKAESGRYRCVLAGSAGHEPEEVPARFVSANFLSATSLRPTAGRTFTAAEERGEGPLVAMLSAWYWKARLNSDARILGRTVTLNAHPVTIVGVADMRFGAGDQAGLLLPLGSQPSLVARGDWLRDSADRWLMLDAVLQPGVTPQRAESEVNALAMERRIPSANPNEGSLVLTPGGGTPRKRRQLLTLAITATLGVAMILLIASSNLANLLLARAVVRRKEIAVRLSMGASRARLVGQLLTESMLLALAGGALGILFSHWLAQAVFLQFGPSWGYELRTDPKVLAYGFVLSLVTGLSFGLAPALSATKCNLTAAFQADGLSASRSATQRIFSARNGLVVVPLALSLMLLLGAGMAVRSVQQMYLNGPVFDTSRLIAVGSPLQLEGYDEARTREFQERLRDRIRHMPGVRSVALASTLPLLNAIGSLPLAGRGSTDYNIISPEFFQTVGVSVVRGRNFTAQDRAGSPPVALVNQEFARRYWQGEEPLGKQIALRGGAGAFEVIGVAPDMEDAQGVINSVRPTVYVPETQGDLFLKGVRTDVPAYQLEVLVRTAANPSPVETAVRQEVLALDPGLRVSIRTASEIRDGMTGQFRVLSMILSGLAGLALLMASLGTYAILAYSVSQRTREIGIRMALGARHSAVLRLVMQRTALLILFSIEIGLAGAFALSRIMTRTVNELGNLDVPTCATVSLLLGAVSLLAGYLPARRALKVDPATALRWE